MPAIKMTHLLATLLLQLLCFDLGHRVAEAFGSVQPCLHRSYRKATGSEVYTSDQTDDRSKSPYLLFPGGG